MTILILLAMGVVGMVGYGCYQRAKARAAYAAYAAAYAAALASYDAALAAYENGDIDDPELLAELEQDLIDATAEVDAFEVEIADAADFDFDGGGGWFDGFDFGGFGD